MPPVPIYSQSPISAAAAATEVTPKTEDPGANRGAQPPPPPPPATTTAAGSAPPPAQPSAVPRLPQPTGAATYQNSYGQQPYNGPAPTPTTTTRPINDGPPPPQPGAVPQPPNASVPYETGGGSQYWSPGAGAAAAAAAAPPPTTALPPQMAMAPISQNQFTVPRGTAPATQAYQAYGSQAQQSPLPQQHQAPWQQQSYTYGYPTQQGPASADLGCHPPGYVQNGYAANTSDSERASNRPPVLYDDSSEEGLWGATKKLAAAAGSKFSAAESEVWRRINGKD